MVVELNMRAKCLRGKNPKNTGECYLTPFLLTS